MERYYTTGYNTNTLAVIYIWCINNKVGSAIKIKEEQRMKTQLKRGKVFKWFAIAMVLSTMLTIATSNLFLAEAAGFDTPITIDNAAGSPAYTDGVTSGAYSWATSTSAGYFLVGINSRSIDGRAAAWAKWKPSSLTAGYYKVEYAYIKYTKAHSLTIKHNGTSDVVSIPGKNSTDPSEWRDVGSYYFAGGAADEYIQADNTAGSSSPYFRVEAVRLTKYIPDEGDSKLYGLSVDTTGTVSPTFDNAVTSYSILHSITTTPASTYRVKPLVIDGAATITVNGTAVSNDTWSQAVIFNTPITIAVTNGASTTNYTINNEYLIDTDSPTYSSYYSEVGTSWSTTGSGTKYGTSAPRVKLGGGTTDAYAQYTPGSKIAGNYKVYFWKSILSAGTPAGVIEVKHNGKIDKRVINWTTGTDGFTDIGNFDFAGSGEEYVRFNAKDSAGSYYIRVDAIKFSAISSSDWDSDANLTGLQLDNGVTLPGEFLPSITTYNAANVQSGKIKVTACASNPLATITVNGASVTNGEQSQAITLNAGTVTLLIAITSKDLNQTKNYTVNLTVPKVGFLNRQFKDGSGNSITSIKAGNIKASADIINNNASGSLPVAYIIAVYNKSTKQMLDVKYYSNNIIASADPSQFITPEINVPSPATNYYVKVFAWDSFDSIVPLSIVPMLQ